MKRHSLKVLSLFLPFIASSCCHEHYGCEWQEYEDKCYIDSRTSCPWSFAPKSCCNNQIICDYQDPLVYEEPFVESFQEPVMSRTNQVIVDEPIVAAEEPVVATEEPVVVTNALGGQKEEKLVEPVEFVEPGVFNLALDLQENPTKYLHFIATLDEENFLILIVKNKETIPLQEIIVRVSIPSLPHLEIEKALVMFDGSVSEGASLTTQTTIGPFTNFDELKDSLEISFVGATPSK